MPKILVVGGGIAGLAVALGLRRAGHTVQVFEASELTSEDTDGAVDQIGPKVNDILEKWGVDPLLTLPVPIKEAGWKFYERSKLHRGLLVLATASTGPGHPLELFLGKKIESVNPKSGSVSVEGGQTYHGTLSLELMGGM
ncbi:uncharacterized protein N7483_000019 [Penicillium malachiteum]|uniref:uncharacterized protein n=1 Tax=Penicillium malachiteum TaxID=1324776 RepID=UPI002546F9DE|nr:uncharacterized protein N7483_000019 [Penicillium malachiteum]KAJ5734894.1 hypothetical protein N7483_000019 [Penicillium malachiteum]